MNVPAHTKCCGWWAPISRELATDLGFTAPDNQPPREPTPLEKALAILGPHLDDQPLYHP